MNFAIFALVFLVSFAITVVSIPVPESTGDLNGRILASTMAATLLTTAVAIGGGILSMLIQMHININVGRRTVDHVFERLQTLDTQKMAAFANSATKSGE
jgi:hypothetical protein